MSSTKHKKTVITLLEIQREILAALKTQIAWDFFDRKSFLKERKLVVFRYKNPKAGFGVSLGFIDEITKSGSLKIRALPTKTIKTTIHAKYTTLDQELDISAIVNANSIEDFPLVEKFFRWREKDSGFYNVDSEDPLSAYEVGSLGETLFLFHSKYSI